MRFSPYINGILWLFWGVTFSVSVCANQASQTPAGNHIYFSIYESQKVENDLTLITLKASVQARSAKIVMEKINQKMQIAFKILEQYPDIQTQTTHYQVHPVYQKDRIIRHWNGSQSLVLTLNSKSKSLQALTELQEPLIYQSMQFKISDHIQQKALQTLTLKALQTFQKQAKLIANAFGTAHFKILETHINSSPTGPAPKQTTFSNRMVMAEAMTAPSLSAGKSNLTIQVSGTLWLPH